MHVRGRKEKKTHNIPFCKGAMHAEFKRKSKDGIGLYQAKSCMRVRVCVLGIRGCACAYARVESARLKGGRERRKLEIDGTYWACNRQSRRACRDKGKGYPLASNSVFACKRPSPQFVCVRACSV